MQQKQNPAFSSLQTLSETAVNYLCRSICLTPKSNERLRTSGNMKDFENSKS